MSETSKKAFEITKHIKENTAETLENVRSGGLTGKLRSQIEQLKAELEQLKEEYKCGECGKALDDKNNGAIACIPCWNKITTKFQAELLEEAIKQHDVHYQAGRDSRQAEIDELQAYKQYVNTCVTTRKYPFDYKQWQIIGKGRALSQALEGE